MALCCRSWAQACLEPTLYPSQKFDVCTQEVEALRQAVAEAQAAAARAQAGLRRAERQAARAHSERRADTSQLALVQVCITRCLNVQP